MNYNAAEQGQRAISAYNTSKQILPFDIAEQTPAMLKCNVLAVSLLSHRDRAHYMYLALIQYQTIVQGLDSQMHFYYFHFRGFYSHYLISPFISYFSFYFILFISL